MEFLLLIDDNPWPHRVVCMPADGSCLFHAISYSVHGDTDHTGCVRSDIVQYVVEHWLELQAYTYDEHGVMYPSRQAYRDAMIKSSTYGSACELVAAGAVYPFTFEVFRDGELKGRFDGGNGGPVKRMRFTGSDLSGHYDVCVPVDVDYGEFAIDSYLSDELHSSSINKRQKKFNALRGEVSTGKSTNKIGRPTKNKGGRPKSSHMSRKDQLRDATARYIKNHPEERKNSLIRYRNSHPEVYHQAVARYTASHPEVNKKAVARYTASHPEVHQQAVARYTASHPQINQKSVERYTLSHPEVHRQAVERYTSSHPEAHKQAVAQWRSKKKLKFEVNVEMLTRSVSVKIGDRLEAEKLVKWALHTRHVTMENLNKIVERLKKKLTVGIEKFRACPCDCSVTTKFEALLGQSEHRDNQEPFYAEQSYKLYQGEDKPIKIDKRGRAVFKEVERNLKGKVWACDGSLCALDETILMTVEHIFKELANKTPAQMYSMATETMELYSNIKWLNTVKAHFPRMRTIVREAYQVQSDCKLISDIDEALKKVDVVKIKELGKQPSSHVGVAVNCENMGEIMEDFIIENNKLAFKQYSKKLLDTPRHQCISCDRLWSRRDVSAIERLRKPLNTDIWLCLLKYLNDNKIKRSPSICHLCLQKMRANQMPATCVLNDLYVSDIPQEIRQLNEYEKLLIQRAKAFQVVTTMQPVTNKHIYNSLMVKKVKGRTFHLPLPLEETLKKLPRPKDPLNLNHELFIVVRGSPTKSKIIWEDIVDVNKVYAALDFLKRVNFHYSEIVMPDTPQQLLNDIDQNLQHMVDKSDLPNNSNRNEETCALLTQITANMEADYEQYTIYPLHERRKNASASTLYQMLKVNTAPVDSSDKALDVKCFPNLFFNGKYGQFHPRKQKLTSSDFIKTRLTSKHPQFRLNQQYLFYLLNDANIRQLSSGIFYKLNAINQKGNMTAEQYLHMLNKDELEGDLTAIFSRLRNTEQFWKKPRNDVICMTRHYGPATWFITMSPSEWMWDDLSEYIKEVDGPEMANKSTSELVAQSPVSTSRFIDNKFKAMLDFLTSSDEPLGKVEHYFWRREYQSRGAQHFHLLLWVKDAPILHESTLEEVAAFIQKYVTCAIPEKNLSPTLHQRVTDYQSHKHNSYCIRKKKTKKGFISVCRFGFPRPVTEYITIGDLTESIAARKTMSSNSRLYNVVRKNEWQMINDYNPAVLLAWNGNIDIQYVGEKTAILNFYVTKYATKGEKTHAIDTFNDINSTKSLRSRLYNIGLRVLGNRECGALEASDTLLGIPLHGTDPQTTIRWMDVNMHRNRRVKSKLEMRLLDPDSTDIFYESWVDNHYPERPKELDNLHLYEFMKNYDIVKTRPVSALAEYFVLEGGKKYLKKRARPYLINHYHYDVQQMPEKYFFSLLLMFKPWRNIDDLKMGFETYTEAFHSVKNNLKDGLAYGDLQTELIRNIEKAFELVEEKVKELETEHEKLQEYEGPDNPLDFEPMEAANAMDDFHDIDWVDECGSKEEIDKMMANLNRDQKRVFDMVTEKLKNESGKNEILRCFVSGTGGTGKSYLIKTIKIWVKQHLNKKVAVSAPTGIAAFNVNGLTIHRLLQLPVEHKYTPKYKQLSDQVLKIIRCDLKDVVLFIIDEVSMISNITLGYIHLRLTEIFDTSDDDDGWFGKKHIMLFGDLLQLPPVRENYPFEMLTTSEVNKLFGSLIVPNMWNELFTYDELTQNMRQNDSNFVKMLQRIRVGITTNTDRDLLHKRLIPLTSDSNENRLKEISHYLSTLDDDTICLLPLSNMCQQLNSAILRAIPHPEIRLIATDSLDCPRFLTKRAGEILKKYKEDSSMTAGLEETIVVKEGVRVMLKRNIDVSLGLVNGSIGTVEQINWDTENEKKVKTLVIKFSHGLLYELSPVKSKFEIMNRAYVHREQFPICVAYGITIHKSQGLSLNNALIDIGSTVFSCGQAYVALSRVKSLEGVHLINLDFSNIKAQEKAIIEYNRLRMIYRPDLPSIEYKKNRMRKIRDREWAMRPTVAKVQEEEPSRKKRKRINVQEKRHSRKPFTKGKTK